MPLQAQYRRILSCRCTADSPQIDYGRYLANRGGGGAGQQHHPTGVLHHGPGTQSARFAARRQISNDLRLTNTEQHQLENVTPLRELRAPAPPHSSGNRVEVERGGGNGCSCIESQVTVERIKEETEPFLK